MPENENLVIIHKPILYREILESLKECVTSGSYVVDCTCGEGGHSEIFLRELDVNLIAFERDPEILAKAKRRLAPFGERVTFINSNFSETENLLPFKGKIKGILYDFGISSYHIDASARGFSFKDEALDMRLDPSCEESAADIVNYYGEKELADLIYLYGEERHSRRIARRIVEYREKKNIESSTELADIVLRASHAKGHHHIHPATRTFQALRIAVNSELEHIEKALNSSWEYLAPGGRVMTISFHSLEDRIAKNIFKKLALEKKISLINKKVIIPQDDEMRDNPRSRSSKLRICERNAV